ncbi:hypothetical protein LR48_Vigan09g059200 [Vigna angularis]|uniref:Putative plant transposon protein domain-containing protein n=1 Tax=Phaseolus angularis TaxID=3914 RepID=A0A0L9VA97_PHAAN|nr:hypothetical protein LR48_Vigan09g059200 [Vigna angularis]
MSINIGQVIANEIQVCPNTMNNKTPLGHPSLITHLCELAGVNISAPPFERPRKAIDEAYYRQYYGGDEAAQPVPPRRSRRGRGPPQGQACAEPHEAEPFQMRDMYMSLIDARMQSIHRRRVGTIEMIIGMYDTPPAHRWTMDEFHNVVAWPEEMMKRRKIQMTTWVDEEVGRCSCSVEPCHGIESSKWAIFGKQNWRCGMNRKLGYGAQLRANLDPTKGVGRLRQQDGGHGSRNPLRRGSGGRCKTQGVSSGGAVVGADLGGSSKYSNENFEGRRGESPEPVGYRWTARAAPATREGSSRAGRGTDWERALRGLCPGRRTVDSELVRTRGI